jgi:hypothetical protein
MSQKITYLLGAGASYDAIPIANNLSKIMQQWVTGPGKDMPVSVKNHSHFQPFIENILEICSEADKADGIDAYAKLLYLNRTTMENKSKLAVLKATLSCWLLARQRGGKIDKRYVHFLTALAQPNNNATFSFDNNINIITWNYDLQLEMTLALRMGVPENKVIELLNAPPPERDQQLKITDSNFFLARINGFAGAHRLGESHNEAGRYKRMLGLVLIKDSFQSMIEILNLYKKYLDHNDLIPAIDFAWEPESMWVRYLRDDVIKVLSKTTHLVIIGYSFPAFNSTIDREILSKMGIEYLTIQDPNANDILLKLKRLVPNWKWNQIVIRPVASVNQLEVVPT